MQKKIWVFRGKIQILSYFDLTEFFHHLYKVKKIVLREKNCQIEIVKFSNFYFFWKSKTLKKDLA